MAGPEPGPSLLSAVSPPAGGFAVPGAAGASGAVRVVLFRGRIAAPYRYADRPKPLDRARLPSDVSPTRRRLLRAHGPQQPQGSLFGLVDDLTTEEYLKLHEVFEELGARTKLVCVFFTADVENGIHVIHWREAHLELDRTFTWLHSEELPVTGPPVG